MPGAEDLVVGIDLGTSTAKVLVLTASGEVVGRARATYIQYRPRPGWVEQSPDDWWDAVCRAVRESLRSVDGRRVRAVGLSGQLNGVVLVDERGHPLRNALIWLDQRAAEQAQRVQSEQTELLSRAGHGTVTGVHVLPKLLWHMENEPKLAERTRYILFPKDYINLRLTDEVATDPSDPGAAAMLDMGRRNWAYDLLDALGIPTAWLPPVYESPEVIGRVTQEGAVATGLPEGTPVVAGAGDMAALAVGTGVVKPGTGCASIATAGHVAIHLDSMPDAMDERLWLMCHAVPGKYFWHGLVLTGGHCLDWFRISFGQAERAAAQLLDVDEYDLLLSNAARVPPGSRGLLFLPFLDGVATPYHDAAARSAFIGATSLHRKEHFVRAVLEGVAYNFRDSFEIAASMGVVIDEVRTGEGGSRSKLWRQILADVLGREVVPLRELDCSALGAACIAGAGAGVWRDLESAVEAAVHREVPVAVNAQHQAAYEVGYALYREAYVALKGLFPKLSG